MSVERHHNNQKLTASTQLRGSFVDQVAGKRKNFFLWGFSWVWNELANYELKATGFISYINKISGIKGESEAADVGKKLRTNSIEVFLRRRILFFCNLKCAIARENALLQLKPLKIVRECREFE